MPEEKNSGWFRNRRTGQVFEAEGAWFRQALGNRDLEEVDGPGEKSDESPSSKLVALRERVAGLGLAWRAKDTEDTLNQRLETRAVELRGEADQLGIRHLPNWRPETLAQKIADARAERTRATSADA